MSLHDRYGLRKFKYVRDFTSDATLLNLKEHWRLDQAWRFIKNSTIKDKNKHHSRICQCYSISNKTFQFL